MPTGLRPAPRTSGATRSAPPPREKPRRRCSCRLCSSDGCVLHCFCAGCAPQDWPRVSRGDRAVGARTSEGLGRRDRVLRRDARVRDHAGQARPAARGARGVLHRDGELALPPRGARPRGGARRRRRRRNVLEARFRRCAACSSRRSPAKVRPLCQAGRVLAGDLGAATHGQARSPSLVEDEPPQGAGEEEDPREAARSPPRRSRPGRPPPCRGEEARAQGRRRALGEPIGTAGCTRSPAGTTARR